VMNALDKEAYCLFILFGIIISLNKKTVART
jgi:hypothetical protein